MAADATDAASAPAWTVLRLDVLPNGARRVRVRKRGGQLVTVYADASVTYGPTLTRFLDQVVMWLPARPVE